MIVYHGSFIEVDRPDTVHSRKAVDFGQGFYVTSMYEQAKKWAEKFGRRGKAMIVSRYELDDKAFTEEKLLRFSSYSEEWLDFIMKCRAGKDDSDYSIVVGGVADDKVFNTVELYFDGLIGKSDAIRRLQFEEPNMQICLRSQKTIDKYLSFRGSEKL